MSMFKFRSGNSLIRLHVIVRNCLEKCPTKALSEHEMSYSDKKLPRNVVTIKTMTAVLTEKQN